MTQTNTFMKQNHPYKYGEQTCGCQGGCGGGEGMTGSLRLADANCYFNA